MTPFEALCLILALLAVFIAVFIKRPVVMPKIVFVNPVVKQNLTTGIEPERPLVTSSISFNTPEAYLEWQKRQKKDIEAELQRTFEIVRKRQQRKRDSKGRFSA